MYLASPSPFLPLCYFYMLMLSFHATPHYLNAGNMLPKMTYICFLEKRNGPLFTANLAQSRANVTY